MVIILKVIRASIPACKPNLPEVHIYVGHGSVISVERVLSADRPCLIINARIA